MQSQKLEQILQTKTKQELERLADTVHRLEEKYKYNKILTMFPNDGKYSRSKYPIHINFMNKGKDFRFRAFMGGNRSGKSTTGATELTYHVTGMYPDWWQGKVQKKPMNWWIICESGALYRDSIQKILLGEDEIGTGLIPKECIESYFALPGTPGAIGTIKVKHKKGHVVTIIVKTYEMSREQFQAAKVDGILFDEEPPENLYTECLMRLMGTGKEPGIAILLFTPCKGLSNVILRYLPKGQFPSNGVPPDRPDCYVCTVDWDHAPHLSDEDKKALLNEIPINERDARTKGIPALGSGKIYPVDEQFITCKPFEIPEYWPRAYGLDFGWVATAVVWVAQDPRTQTKYVYTEYKRGQTVDSLHIESVKRRGDWIPGIADPSGGGRNQSNGQLKIDEYRQKGLILVPGYNAIRVGIDKILNEFESGSLKIFFTCEKLLEEIRIYRYDTRNPNEPAKNQEDHLCDALKYVISRFEEVAISESEHDKSQLDEPWVIDQTHGRDTLTGY